MYRRYDCASSKEVLQSLASDIHACRALEVLAATEAAFTQLTETLAESVNGTNPAQESLAQQAFRVEWRKSLAELTAMREHATMANNESLAGALYCAELAVVALKPLNDESLYFEKIPADKQVVVTSGYQFNIDEMTQWLALNKTTNPYTNDSMGARDLAEIRAVSELFVLQEGSVIESQRAHCERMQVLSENFFHTAASAIPPSGSLTHAMSSTNTINSPSATSSVDLSARHDLNGPSLNDIN